jgi:arginine decarboxylase
MRSAFYLSYDARNCDYTPIDAALPEDPPTVSAAFVTPYPPGFPILVPGQVVTDDILNYLRAVDVKEIHGFDPTRGLLVFRQTVLEELQAARSTGQEATNP